jgi:putative tryptophan/tyrosine transport system substrate-binding protein
MKRRDFIAGLGSVAAWPAVGRAQQAKVPVIGVLGGSSLEAYRPQVIAFHQGLADAGYTEGRDVAIEYRWAEDDYTRLPALVADLVRRQVNVIAVLSSTAGALAAKAATQTIPIVYQIGTDPVQVGLAASLARPGGNLTGITTIVVELMAKCLSVMHELVPAAATVAVLLNPGNVIQTETEMRDAEVAARSLGVRVVFVRASRPEEIVAAFAMLAPERADALVVSGENFFFTQRDLIVSLAARYAVPTMYLYPEIAASGGLVGYGPITTPTLRVAGNYVGRILKGEKPADLPVQQSAKIELAINLKTAKALGLSIPPNPLVRADEVIE